MDTCVKSEIVGGLVGIEKSANIIMVKTMGWVSSVLDAVSKINLDIEHRNGHLMKGCVVGSISLGYDGDFCENERQIKGFLARLVKDFQLVIIVSTVGSVQSYGGKTLEWSRVGSDVTTYTPAYVRCAHPSPGAHNNALYSGTGYSTAMVSGVFSAWLSDEYGGELLERPPPRSTAGGQEFREAAVAC